MPNWDGIEDVSVKPLPVWLSRVKETDDWKPLRKADCWALNQTEESKVIIEGGRTTADKSKGVITSNFFRAPERTLASATWFVRKEPNAKDKPTNLDPLFNKADTEKIEALYQLAIEASSSLGTGIDNVLKDEVELEDESKVKVAKTNGGTVLCIQKKPKGWLLASQHLQRGYGAYTVDGEENELMLGPLKHLYFVVHGIGEAIWSREDSTMFGITDECNRVRMSIQQRQVDAWRLQNEKCKKAGKPPPPMPDRIEFIPIEWYDQVHSSSGSLSKSLKAVTLPTIPALRGIANEAVFDVLVYITPAFCGPVLECVTSQITNYYNKFLEVHPSFLDDGGACSLIGHSLGSVICWDLLSILKDFGVGKVPPRETFGEDSVKRMSSGGVAFQSEKNSVDVGFQAYEKASAAGTPQNGIWGPTLPEEKLYKTLPFVPENVILLGSPIGMFLTLRGAHPAFDALREERVKEILEAVQSISADEEDDKSKKGGKEKSKEDKQQLPYASPFTLPVTGGLYNIFHPSDPVAYRIEPLLLPPTSKAEELPAPVHLTAQGQEVRLHVKAQQFGDEIARVFEKTGSWATLITHAVSSIGKTEAIEASREAELPPTGPQVFPLGGKSERVDFQLQRGVVDNEYISAVTAHSTYFVNTDVQDFIMGLAFEKMLGKEAEKLIKEAEPDII